MLRMWVHLPLANEAWRKLYMRFPKLLNWSGKYVLRLFRTHTPVVCATVLLCCCRRRCLCFSGCVQVERCPDGLQLKQGEAVAVLLRRRSSTSQPEDQDAAVYPVSSSSLPSVHAQGLGMLGVSARMRGTAAACRLRAAGDRRCHGERPHCMPICV